MKINNQNFAHSTPPTYFKELGESRLQGVQVGSGNCVVTGKFHLKVRKQQLKQE